MKRGRHQDKRGVQCASAQCRSVLMTKENDVRRKSIHLPEQSESIPGTFDPSGINSTLECQPPVLQTIPCRDVPGEMQKAG